MAKSEGVDVLVETGDVSVVDKEVKEGFKRHTLYKVEVKIEGDTVTIFRRYSQFLSIFEKLKKKFPSIPMKLPGKKIFGTFDPEVIRSRRHAVKDFVAKLITVPELMQHNEVHKFLGLDLMHGNQGDDVDDEAYYSGQSRISTRRNSTRRNSTEGEQTLVLGNSNYSVFGQPHAKPSDFEFLNVIGRGTFGKVLLARHRESDKLVAVKILSKELILKNNEAEHIMCERRVLSLNAKHPFLVSLHYSFQTKDKLYFVMDYVSGGEIFFHLQKEKRFSECRSRFYAAEIASAVGFLHSSGIIYRDLKPENILLDKQGHIMLTDFGLCKEGTPSTFCGTPEYLCPELLRQEKYDRMVDWWCLGVILYEMIFGLPPFYNRDRAEMFQRILNTPLEFKNGIISPSARSILTELLEKDKNLRLGARNDFEDIKCHSFFSSIDWSLLNCRELTPPFVPQLSEIADVGNFDSNFTTEQVTESVACNDLYDKDREGKTLPLLSRVNTGGLKAPKGEFDGFTYIRPADEAFPL